MDHATADPKGLIRESYRIDGITPGECRSIFMDWALSLPVDTNTTPALQFLMAAYAPTIPNHPMTTVMTDALTAPAKPTRKGGRGARLGYIPDPA
ncbi:hypothetical protein SAMN05216227_100761 [Pseudorhodobacter antarcticus]|uniref:Uncharacterized protein n=1 Tax=Pseudorhodobacter antarcticus TaxID=1077947 RepID=A0A1H8DML6_9RHOB|nr:hypothetical protein [Pseudorhodobacter antarcticus]SEN08395.1 hypothetical protein SAMN05216227_100761 [Pseudorhodobacter antarcticus]